MQRVYRTMLSALEELDAGGASLIGISGGSCSGKTRFAGLLSRKLGGSVILMDDYYVGRSRMRDDNFDSPEAIDLKLWAEHLKTIKSGGELRKPMYDFKTHERTGFEPWKPVLPVIAEGLFVLMPPQADELDLKIFIEARPETRFERRCNRDIAVRGYALCDIRRQWSDTVELMYREYVEPQKDLADIIIYNDRG